LFISSAIAELLEFAVIDLGYMMGSLSRKELFSALAGAEKKQEQEGWLEALKDTRLLSAMSRKGSGYLFEIQCRRSAKLRRFQYEY
jgi:hypothetical protein